MKAILSAILICGLILKVSSQIPPNCEFIFSGQDYTCNLKEGAIFADKVPGDIEGVHWNKTDFTPYEDKDVKRIVAISLAYEFVLQKIFNQFRNLESIEFPDGALNEIDKKFFYNCDKITNFIFLRGNVENVKAESFMACTALKSLILKGNSIKSLDSTAFKGLAELETLDLSDNQISNPNAAAFTSLANLKVLNLADNTMASLAETIFASNANLEELYLSSNRIEQLKKRHLDSNSKLQKFIFNDNKLNKTERGFFDKLSLETANFLGNECIDKYYDNVDKATITADFEECFKRNGAFRTNAELKHMLYVSVVILALSVKNILDDDF